ncbi:MAG: aminopeptidase [Deltaproteobacteria bacterium]|nr:aminopeptidase [Deltaproteobacteria bacterium]
MFTEKQLDKYAEVLLWGLQKARRKKYKKNDIVAVRYNLPALRLAEILQARLLDQGLNPILRLLATSVMEHTFFSKANNRQLVFEPPGEKDLYRSLHGSIFLHAPESLTHLQHVDSTKIAKAALARKPLRDILQKREENGDFGWTLCSYTTAPLARHARLSEKQYTNQIIKACYLNKPDPVAEWEAIFNNAREIKKWLNGMQILSYRVESKNTDLSVTHGDKRRWVGISGHNIPSFELFISPDWRGTEGIYFANQPSYRNGNYIQDVRLEFKKGSVVNSSAKRGDDFVKKQLRMDKGAGRLGEFSLTDIRFSKIDRFMADTLFDENYGGTSGNCHVAVGSSYSDAYAGKPASLTKKKKEQLGFNDSALHWDLVNTETKVVTAHLKNGKNKVIYEKGKFQY